MTDRAWEPRPYHWRVEPIRRVRLVDLALLMASAADVGMGQPPGGSARPSSLTQAFTDQTGSCRLGVKLPGEDLMGVIVVEIPIARPAADVFSYMRDHSHQMQWQAGHVLKLDVEPPGPAQVGTKVHKTRRTPIGQVSFTEEVTDLDETGRSWTELTTTGGLTGTTVAWQVHEEGQGARVRLTANMRGRGMMRVMLPMIRRSARNAWESELANLKQLLETGSEG